MINEKDLNRDYYFIALDIPPASTLEVLDNLGLDQDIDEAEWLNEKYLNFYTQKPGLLVYKGIIYDTKDVHDELLSHLFNIDEDIKDIPVYKTSELEQYVYSREESYLLELDISNPINAFINIQSLGLKPLFLIEDLMLLSDDGNKKDTFLVHGNKVLGWRKHDSEILMNAVSLGALIEMYQIPTDKPLNVFNIELLMEYQKKDLEAINELSLREIPSFRKTAIVCKAAVSDNPINIKYVPASKLTKEIIIDAVSKDYTTMQYISQKEFNEDIYLRIVEKNPYAYFQIPSDERSKEIQEKTLISATKEYDPSIVYNLISEINNRNVLCDFISRSGLSYDFEYLAKNINDKVYDKKIVQTLLSMEPGCIIHIPERFLTMRMCLDYMRDHMNENYNFERLIQRVPYNVRQSENFIYHISQFTSTLKIRMPENYILKTDTTNDLHEAMKQFNSLGLTDNYKLLSGYLEDLKDSLAPLIVVNGKILGQYNDISNDLLILQYDCSPKEDLQRVQLSDLLKVREEDLRLIREEGLGAIPLERRDKKLCLEAIKNNAYDIKYIPEDILTKKMIYKALKQDGDLLKYIPSDRIKPQMCEVAVNNKFIALKHVPEKFRNGHISDIAVRRAMLEFNFFMDHKQIQTLKYIRNPEASLYLAEKLIAEDVNPVSVATAIKMSGMMSKQMCSELFALDYRTYQCFPDKFKTKEMASRVVNKDGELLACIPYEHHTPEILEEAVKNNPETIRYISESSRTPEMYLRATLAGIEEKIPSSMTSTDNVMGFYNKIKDKIIDEIDYEKVDSLFRGKSIDVKKFRSLIEDKTYSDQTIRFNRASNCLEFKPKEIHQTKKHLSEINNQNIKNRLKL